MSDQPALALTKEQEAMADQSQPPVGLPPGYTYMPAAPSYVPVSAPPVAYMPGGAQPVGYMPGGAQPVAYMPGGAQPVAYMPGTAQPVTVLPAQMMVVKPEQFITDYSKVAFAITITFAILGAPSLLTGIPAVLLAIRSRRDLKEGKLQQAKIESVASAYLMVATLIIGFLTFLFAVLLPLGYRYQINDLLR